MKHLVAEGLNMELLPSLLKANFSSEYVVHLKCILLQLNSLFELKSRQFLQMSLFAVKAITL